MRPLSTNSFSLHFLPPLFRLKQLVAVMGVDMAGACFHCPQPLLPPHQTTAFLSLLGTRSISAITTNKHTRDRLLRRAITAGVDSFFTDDDDEEQFVTRLSKPTNHHSICTGCPTYFSVPNWPEFRHTDLTVERRASSVELPMSLRLIKRKKRAVVVQEVGETACSSVKTAFSSMVFMIGELQTYTMRELLLTENLNGILDRVQGEMHASFVWLFQRIFSCTPTLMLSLMLLLANFTVYHTGAVAAAAPPPSAPTATVSELHVVDSSPTKTFSVGGGDGGGKRRPVAGATDDSWSDRRASFSYRGNTITISTSPVTDQDEVSLWKVIEEDAMKMQAALRGEALMDPETLRNFVSPVTVEMEAEDDSVYLKTELMYLGALSRDPKNALLLTNFAQFLFSVLRDLDRAEYYFKLALKTEPRDAESLARYASFLWVARKNIGAAEENYLEAIAADPANSFHTANYANFLWSTGGEGTCYPI